MYTIKKLDDKQLENITGGIASLTCLALGSFVLCMVDSFTAAFFYRRHNRNERLTENSNRQHFNDVIEDVGIPVNNIEYSDDDTSTVD